MSQVIEMLRFEVSASDRKEWLAVERRVWTGFLKTIPGFQRQGSKVDD